MLVIVTVVVVVVLVLVVLVVLVLVVLVVAPCLFLELGNRITKTITIRLRKKSSGKVGKWTKHKIEVTGKLCKQLFSLHLCYMQSD